MQIWGFGIEDKTAGGKAGITFGAKHLLTQKMRMYSGDINYSKWTSWGCPMRKELNGEIYNNLPPNLKSGIKQVNTYSYGFDYHEDEKSEDFLWIPSITNNNPKMSSYAIFTDNDSRKRTLGQDGDYEMYYSRDMGNSHGSFRVIDKNGMETTCGSTTNLGVLMCFCI